MGLEQQIQTDLQEWLAQSQSPFDVLVCKDHQLPSGFEILDGAKIDRIWRSASEGWVGTGPLHKAQFPMQHIAHRVARKLAKSNADQVGVSVNGLRNAWFHPVLSELATLIPIRHLARKLAAQGNGKSFAIPLRSRDFVALNSWHKNDIEPIYLAYELRRHKVPVVLFIDDDGRSDFSFQLSTEWLSRGYPQVRRNKSFSTVMCKRAIRNASYVSEKSGAKRKHKPSFFTYQRHFGINPKPTKMRLNSQKGPSFGGLQVLSAPSDTPSLDSGFIELIGPLTKKVAKWYRQELKDRPVRRACISDHATFEGGLLAAEVVKKGGMLEIWPHSANLVHMHVHDPKEVAHVTVVARSTAAHWKKAFGAEKVSINSRSLLPEISAPIRSDARLPIHVILFAGAHALRRWPLVDYQRHTETWSRVLKDLLNSNVELTIKHKSSWETRDWIRGLAPKNAKLRFSRTHANKLNSPNMLFMSISMTSTATLEGIARGIPGLTVRDAPIIETPYYDPDFIPCLPSEKVADYIADLHVEGAMDSLREKQRIWFERETT